MYIATMQSTLGIRGMSSLSENHGNFNRRRRRYRKLSGLLHEGHERPELRAPRWFNVEGLISPVRFNG